MAAAVRLAAKLKSKVEEMPRYGKSESKSVRSALWRRKHDAQRRFSILSFPGSQACRKVYKSRKFIPSINASYGRELIRIMDLEGEGMVCCLQAGVISAYIP
jgi:hypothetical protein